MAQVNMVLSTKIVQHGLHKTEISLFGSDDIKYICRRFRYLHANIALHTLQSIQTVL